MGYRSDFLLGIDSKEYFKHKIKNTIPPLLTELSLTEVEHDDETKVLYFHATGYKMDESHPDVAEFLNWLEILDEEKFGYMRNGEEYDDMEQKGDCSLFNIYAYSGISIPY